MRILSAAPSNTEILYALGLEDQVIATTSLCDFPARVKEKPSIGGWSDGVNYNKIDELEPDIILMSDQLQDEQASKLSERFEVLQVNPVSLEEVFESIEKIGRRFDRKKEASEIVSEMKEEIEGVDLEGKRIYCEEWSDPPMVSGNWIPDLIEKANGDYFIEGGRSRKFDLEKLKDFNPEYIFLNICGAGENFDREEILDRPEWQDITAVKNGEIYVVDDALLNRPGPRLAAGSKEIEKNI